MLKHPLLILGILAFGAVIAYRAFAIPFTHDEATTWIYFRHFNIWTCTHNAECWGSANNHWLNTMLLQITGSLFGDNPLALRLPNVFAGVAYLICAALICARYVENYALRLAAFMLLCCHVYLVDFFSLARGYGLMVCGIIWGIYGMMRYIERLEPRWLLVSIGMLFFAILGNFTALLPWAAIGLGWLAWVIMLRKFNLVIRHGVYWALSAILLFFLLRFPIRILGTKGEFEWGAKTLWETGTNLLENLMDGIRYFGQNSFNYEFILVLIFIGLTFVGAALHTNSEKKNRVLLMLLFLLTNAIVVYAQQKITGAQTPVGRKSIYLIPFIFGALAMGLGLMKNNGTSSFIGIIISLAFIGHFIFTLELRSCREWYYDAYYPQLFSEIIPEGAASDSVSISSSWAFNPALVFYQRSVPLPIYGLKYQHKLEIDTSLQYYFVEASDTTGMTAKGFSVKKTIEYLYLYENDRY